MNSFPTNECMKKKKKMMKKRYNLLENLPIPDVVIVAIAVAIVVYLKIVINIPEVTKNNVTKIFTQTFRKEGIFFSFTKSNIYSHTERKTERRKEK